MHALKISVAVMLLLLGAMSAYAHHSFNALFDVSQTIIVTGEIEQFRFIAPHSYILLTETGEGDSQVDWRASKKLYEDVYQEKGNLTVQTFKNCNHILRKCKTCGYREDLSDSNWAFCDGYFETMERWLRTQKFIE